MFSSLETYLHNLHLGRDLMYCIELVAMVILVLLVNLCIRYALHFISRQASRTKTSWDTMIVKSANAPIRAAVWVFAVAYAAHIIQNWVKTMIPLSVVTNFLKIGILLCVLWFAMRMVSHLESYFIKKFASQTDSPTDETSINALTRLAQVVVVLVGVLVALQIFHIPLSGLLTFGGVTGAVIAFSAKDMMANFFGGLMIYLDRPFAVGDWISSPDKQIEGTVEHIGWRMTRIRSFAKRPIYVPNNVFSDIVVVNPSRMTNRRIKQNISIRYDDAERVQSVLDGIKKMLAEHSEIDQTKTTLVNLVSFDASYIVFMIYTFTKTTNWVKFQNIQDDVMLKAEKIIRECGAECAFPTTTLHVPDGLEVFQGEAGK